MAQPRSSELSSEQESASAEIAEVAEAAPDDAAGVEQLREQVRQLEAGWRSCGRNRPAPLPTTRTCAAARRRSGGSRHG